MQRRVPRDGARWIVTQRLLAQHLAGEPFSDVAEAVRWFGAVQSQDFAASTWALGQRIAGSTQAAVVQPVDSGTILRTHVLRPTWHLVHRDDIRWMLALSGPRLRQAIAGRWRRLELDARTIARALDVIAAALAGGAHCTRAQLGRAIDMAGIAPDGQRLPHLLMAAELDALIVSGPRSGSEATYALLDERAPRGIDGDPEQWAQELALRYFRSHGPAQVQDFAWWSGLTLSDARHAVAALGVALRSREVDGRVHWSDAQADDEATAARAVHLLPNFDEYTVAYRDRSALIDPRHPIDPAQLAFGSVLSNVVIDEGGVVAAWRRLPVRRGAAILEVRPFGGLSADARSKLEQAAVRMGRFFGLDLTATVMAR